MTHHALCAALLPTGALCAKSSPFFRVRLPRSNSSVHARRVTIERTAVYKDCKLLYQSLASASAPHLATATDKLSLCLIIITPNDLHANMSSESASLYSTTSTVPVSLYSVSSKTLLKSEEAPSPRQSSSSKSRSLLAKIFHKSASSTPARPPQTPEEIFREIMNINASSGAPQVKAWMYHSEWEEKRAVPTKKTAKKLKSTSPRAPLRTSQETADEIMRLNATHGHPSVKAYLASLK